MTGITAITNTIAQATLCDDAMPANIELSITPTLSPIRLRRLRLAVAPCGQEMSTTTTTDVLAKAMAGDAAVLTRSKHHRYHQYACKSCSLRSSHASKHRSPKNTPATTNMFTKPATSYSVTTMIIKLLSNDVLNVEM